MIGRDDLRAAVGAGILTEAQAAAVMVLTDSRRGARENLNAGDEPFELFRGFNEIFIVIGLAILGTGWVGVLSIYLASRVTDVRSVVILASLASVVVLWLLAEYFVRRRRMVAPAIALSVMFAINAVYGFAMGLGQPIMIAQSDYSSLPIPLALTTFALLIFWFRFRVPFALAMIAIGAFAVALLTAAITSGSPGSMRQIFLLSAGGPFAWITLVLGLIVFAAAMAFDMSDPHRVTRPAANGFWLHVIAAPALVNTVALSMLEREGSGSNQALFAVLIVFAFVAIVIDRRSFLIAAIGYITVLASAVFGGQGAVMTIFILGGILLGLGAFWEKIRARLLAVLPGFIPLDRLPPSANTKD